MALLTIKKQHRVIKLFFPVVIILLLGMYVITSADAQTTKSNKVIHTVGNPATTPAAPSGSPTPPPIISPDAIWPTRRGYVIYDSFVLTHPNLKAIDLNGVDTTDDILATHDGLVIYAAWEGTGTPPINGSYGNVVLVASQTDNIITLYAHMSQILTQKGATVTKGQVIGKVGGTSSNGQYAGKIHLHYEHRLKNGGYGVIGQPAPALAPPILPKIIPDRCASIAACNARW